MTPPDPAAPARAALRRHLIATVAVVLAVMIGMLAATWHLIAQEADRITTAVSTRVAASVSDTLRSTAFPADAAGRAALDEQLRGYFDSGTIARVKVWRVEGDRVRVVYSDEPRAEGHVREFSAELAARLDAGEVAVFPVPDDAEHRHEQAEGAELREAFIGFTDPAGTALRLEVYVLTHRDDMLRSSLAAHVPVLAGGIVALLAVLVPLSVSLARRLSALERERRDAVSYGLQARAEERLDLARRLHDGVVQDLAGAGLALQSLRPERERDRAVLARVVELIGDDTRLLRGVLDEFLDETPGAEGLEDALAGIAESLREAGLSVSTRVDAVPDDDTAAVIARCAQELARNVVAHSGADRVRLEVTSRGDAAVVLVVEDDGHGIGPQDRGRDGHVGLLLVERAARARGGSLDVGDRDGGGTRIEAVFPRPRESDSAGDRTGR